ncbi:MAG: GNAT family N-acetyltransferase [Paracoccaceae bacterium]
MTPALIAVDDDTGAPLARALQLEVPSDWPPEFHGPETRAWYLDTAARHPDELLLPGYYIAHKGCLVGICGFKALPGAGGMIEIGYSVVASMQRRGIATAAVGQLLALGFADPRVSAVTAETLPALIASQRVAEQTGMRLVASRPDSELGEILTYRIDRI